MEIVVSEQDARKLLDAKDSRACLLFLRIKAGPCGDEKALAAELGWSMAELRAAAARLESLGLAPAKPLEPADEPPRYSTADITRTLEADGAFSEVLRYTQSRLGRVLNTADISRILGVYQNVGLPAGALMLLVSFCDDRVKRKSGPGAHATAYQIEKEAYRWAREGVATESDAEELVRRLENVEQRASRLAHIVQISGRSPTRTEREYLERWSGLSLDDDAVYAAYDKTVINTGGMKWSYMDKILSDWSENGVPTAAAANAQSAPPAARRPASAPAGQTAASAARKNVPPRAADSERLRRLRELEEKKRG